MSHENASPRHLAGELREAAERLTESIRTDAAPAEAAAVLGDLVAVHGLLTQTYAQIAEWHRGVGEVSAGRDRALSSPTEQTAARLDAVGKHADMVDLWLSAAHASSVDVEWLTRASAASQEPAPLSAAASQM